MKPIRWYIYKFLAEIFYWISQFTPNGIGVGLYYKYLNKLCATGFNLYGDEIK
jgi:hypothetical protein